MDALRSGLDEVRDGAGATGSGVRSRVTAAKAAPAVAVAASAPIQATAPVVRRRDEQGGGEEAEAPPSNVH
ncbi:hypothetical protein AB0B85_15570 [Micromonospora sp. NPDC049044]|uniref:hypothetical protein n=1 Tax=Micromonospora sp. NPDC049044 TaxID=3154827 RepID=UPI0033C5A966